MALSYPESVAPLLPAVWRMMLSRDMTPSTMLREQAMALAPQSTMRPSKGSAMTNSIRQSRIMKGNIATTQLSNGNLKRRGSWCARYVHTSTPSFINSSSLDLCSSISASAPGSVSCSSHSSSTAATSPRPYPTTCSTTSR